MILYVSIAVLTAFIAWLWHINRAFEGTPEGIARLAGKPYTEEAIRACYAKVEKEGVDFKKHLPPKTGRRYIVTGGAGFLGKHAVRHLILRGESPEAIRIVDIRDPKSSTEFDKIRGAHKYNEYEPVRKAVASVAFERADVTDPQSVLRAFQAPWPESVRNKNLTVFHTAALIRHWERADIFVPRQSRVNVDGTKNVLAAAKAVGATVLVSTSSSSVGVRSAEYWVPPWRRWAKYTEQVIADDSPGLPSKKEEFFSNYSYTKWVAEKFVSDADERGKPGGLRTGIVRPGHGIYGPCGDFVAGTYLRLGGGPTWIGHVIQSFVSVENVMLAHLCYERCLLNLQSGPSSSRLPDIGGRTFLATDPNPAIRSGDLYRVLTTMAATPVAFTKVTPIFLFLFSYLVEAYDIVRHYAGVLPALQFPLEQLQPALFGVCDAHTIIDDRLAKEKPENGGLGYAAPIDTLTGLCFQVLQWNLNVARDKNASNGKIELDNKENPVIRATEMTVVQAQGKI